MFDRLPYNFTESERKRRQPEAIASSNRQPFANRRSSQDKEAVAVSAVTSAVASTATGGGTSGPNTLVAARKSVGLDAGGTRADERGGR